MKRELTLKHEFVEYIPDLLQDGTIYVSTTFATAAHKCCCGCGREVVTPLSPTDWELTFDGNSVSLYPSIGNWSFPCQSHYWIIRNRVRWARQWSRDEIRAGRAQDSLAKERYFGNDKTPMVRDMLPYLGASGKGKPKKSLWMTLKEAITKLTKSP